MPEITNTNITNTDPTDLPQPSKIGGFKNICLRIGLMMICVFVVRGICSILLSLMYPLLEQMDIVLGYALQTLMSFVFLDVIPITLAIFILKEPSKETRSRLYQKPVYLSNAIGVFPACYGMAIFVNLLTLVVSYFLSKSDFVEASNPLNSLPIDNIPCGIISLVNMVIIAPICEEFWFRGIVMESLRPYGNGFAIFVSAFLFGLTHANFQQFFYATVMGICLGYIAISTKSLVTTTIMHAMLNSVSGLLLFFMSIESVGDYLMAMDSGREAEMTPAVIVFLVYQFLVIMLMLVGIIMAAFKLRKIRRYKVPKMWTELSTGKRWGIFFSRATVIVMLLLAADTFTFQFIPNLIYSGIMKMIG